MTNQSKPKKERVTIDWEAVERDYRIGQLTIREIQQKHGVSNGGMMARAKREGWTRDILEKIEEEKAKEVEAATKARTASLPGFIYVITFDAGDGERYYKIGMSADLLLRMKSLQCSMPYELRVATSYFVENMAEEEAALHEAYKAKRVRSEWFELSSEDLSSIAAKALRK